MLYGVSFPMSAEAMSDNFILPIGKAKVEREVCMKSKFWQLLLTELRMSQVNAAQDVHIAQARDVHIAQAQDVHEAEAQLEAAANQEVEPPLDS